MSEETPSRSTPGDRRPSAARILAEASHDLQQPLQAMGLLIEALRNHALSEEAASIVARLAEAHGATRTLLTAMLDLSRIESRTVRLEIESVRLDDIMAELKATFRPIAADKGVVLTFVSSSAVARTDPAWIVRILGNLIANALAHSGGDRIVVGCRRRGADIRVEVLDRGAGMEPARLETALAGEGQGMGLAIAAAAADLLGHPLEGETAPGAGTRFVVTVPFAGDAGDG